VLNDTDANPNKNRSKLGRSNLRKNSREVEVIERLAKREGTKKYGGDAMMPSNEQKLLYIFCFCSRPFFGGLRIVIRSVSFSS
jgi:hypothetical protein